MLQLSMALLVVAAPSLKLLDATMPAIAKRAEPGRLGVAVYDFATGRRWSLRGDEGFPLQSVFKVMAGARMLQEVDAGRRRIDEPVQITARELSVFWSPITDEWRPPAKTYPLRRLIELAVAVSDNTAGDHILRLGGGPSALNAMFAKAGINGVRVDRYERELQPECAGLPPFPPEAVIDVPKFARDVEAQPDAVKTRALEAYLADPRDTATPNGAVDFLVALANGKLLGAESTSRLLAIMTSTTTGKHRMKAGLPAGVALAHKTGTANTVLGTSPAVNDIGIVTLVDGRRVAIAVFLSGARGDEASREGILAEVARLVVEASR
ncbi:MAG: class A beta-lactamase [Myxococcota bacterium]